MLIDFHTHAFPDKIAEKTIAFLENSMEEASKVKACTDGTVAGLAQRLEKSGVDVGVICPIATKPTQTEHINDFAEKIRGDRLISFGSLHPLGNDCNAVLENLKARGFLGIKLHPEYQSFDIDCRESIEVIAKAESLGMYVVVHAGSDPAFVGSCRCSPEKVHNLLQYTSGKTLICAHLGGRDCFDDVEKYIVGTPVLLDTAAISLSISVEQARRIILNHGADKVLFASDCPWENPEDSLKFLKSLKLPKADFEQIAYKNACGILGIKPAI